MKIEIITPPPSPPLLNLMYLIDLLHFSKKYIYQKCLPPKNCQFDIFNGPNFLFSSSFFTSSLHLYLCTPFQEIVKLNDACTTRPDKHGREFLVACKKHATALNCILAALDKSCFTRYQNNTAMHNQSPCTLCWVLSFMSVKF